jgi:hypothetical protein
MEMMQSAHCHLTSLKLHCNELLCGGAAALAAALRTEHCRLTSLDLSENWVLEEDGATAVAAAL